VASRRRLASQYMAQLSIPQLPSGVAHPGAAYSVSVVGLLALIAALFLLYLVSPFFTVGDSAPC
jgi:hypothetical protein